MGLTYCSDAAAKPFRIQKGEDVAVSYPRDARSVLSTSVQMLSGDMAQVFGNAVHVVESDAAVKVEIDPEKVRKREGFRLEVDGYGTLTVTGHDSHGAAFGVLEISRLIGVSPWEWWADAVPEPMEQFELSEGYVQEESPSVRYRGVFINDEDWGLMPWSSKTYEPSDIKGHIGPKTTARIFELLLRLRANTYWPPMHECSLPFFLTPGNREVAEKYGIYVGSSHCEPMACNAAGEWSRRGKGEYDYVNNKEGVYDFWERRVRDVAGQEMLYTIGMRGVHDGAMNGAKTVEEQKRVLDTVFRDQRELLSRYVNPDVTQVPQVFIPYKEVLDIYNAGLKVPEDVTLMWCDDNYGYIRHFPTEAEAKRKGGNGIYYHVSYWGRPHDYLWLGTFSPYLMYQQMKLAYDKGIRDIWILNVGDIKPAEYQIELFMDMAWAIDKVERQGVGLHLEAFLAREFGESAARELLTVMNGHYRLAYIRKPEFMGGTRTEEPDRAYWNTVRDLSWNLDSINMRENEYNVISDIVERIWDSIPEKRKDTYYQLVKYPVQAACQMSLKMTSALKARHGLEAWSRSDAAFDSIVAMTDRYNGGFHNNGKWNRIMDYQPRRLAVFNSVEHREDSTALPRNHGFLHKWNGREVQGLFDPVPGLGYEAGAVALKRNEPVSVHIPAVTGRDSLIVDMRFMPNHPVEPQGLVFALTLDGHTVADSIHYETKGRSEEWKHNVLRNQAVRRVSIPNDEKGHILQIVPLTEGIVLDQILIY